ncbi:MAG: sulfatase [Phycisphaerales bacterium]|nr:sulfatase [Phycisphaerales bacterium]
MLHLITLLVSTLAAEPQQPNIVVMYVDDMGWGDLPSQGATEWKMPNLDRLQDEGTRFTQFYVAQPVCSASRAALLTGCYPNRLGIHGALWPKAPHGIHEDETTIAEMLKAQGYTTGVFGKWHLGTQPFFLPPNHGFDEFLGIPYSNDMWPGHPERPKQWPPLPLIEGRDTIERIDTLDGQAPLTRRFTERAVEFIDRAVESETPFFCYVPHPQPHVPLARGEAFAGSSEQGWYGDVMQEIDWSMGEIMAALDRHEIADDTLVIFASDNGPWLNYGDHAGTVAHLREGKGTTFEGGVRVPCIARWPGRVRPDHISDVHWMTIDLLPTIAAITGAPLPERSIDGADATAVLAGDPDAGPPQEAYLFYYRENELQAIRSGRWKLHLPHSYRSLEGRPGGSGGVPIKYNYGMHQPLALYDIEVDPAESIDVQHAHPEVMAHMLSLAEAARSDLGDKLTKRAGAGRREPGRIEGDG